MPRMNGLPDWARREKLFPLIEIARMDQFPIELHKRTLRNYIREGLKNWHGVAVKLDAVRIGRKYHTSAEAVWRFIDEASL